MDIFVGVNLRVDVDLGVDYVDLGEVYVVLGVVYVVFLFAELHIVCNFQHEIAHTALRLLLCP